MELDTALQLQKDEESMYQKCLIFVCHIALFFNFQVTVESHQPIDETFDLEGNDDIGNGNGMIFENEINQFNMVS